LTTRKSRRPPPPSDLARWRDSWSQRGPTTCHGRQLPRAQSRGRGRRMDGHAAARKPVGAARSRARQGTTCGEWMSSSSGLPSASSKIRPWPRGGGWGRGSAHPPPHQPALHGRREQGSVAAPDPKSRGGRRGSPPVVVAGREEGLAGPRGRPHEVDGAGHPAPLRAGRGRGGGPPWRAQIRRRR
jgi:hypothetical protein